MRDPLQCAIDAIACAKDRRDVAEKVKQRLAPPKKQKLTYTGWFAVHRPKSYNPRDPLWCAVLKLCAYRFSPGELIDTGFEVGDIISVSVAS